VKGSDNLCDYVKRVIANYGIEKLQEKPLCGVGTVHSVKGGEADVVILAPDISLEAVNAMNRSEAAREEMWRVFYTGCTRAKEVLLLADPSSRNAVRW
jgi:superfamily I DNA/RNA helicase